MKIKTTDGFIDFELEEKDTMAISLSQMRDLRRRDISTMRIEDRPKFFNAFCKFLPLLRYLKHNGYEVVCVHSQMPSLFTRGFGISEHIDITSHDGVIPKIFFPPEMVVGVDISDSMGDYDWTELLNRVKKFLEELS